MFVLNNQLCGLLSQLDIFGAYGCLRILKLFIREYNRLSVTLQFIQGMGGLVRLKKKENSAPFSSNVFMLFRRMDTIISPLFIAKKSRRTFHYFF
jgi:hypothetical protein